MNYKSKILCRVLDAMEDYRPSQGHGGWNRELIDEETAERVIGVMQNVVSGIMHTRSQYHGNKFDIDWFEAGDCTSPEHHPKRVNW